VSAGAVRLSRVERRFGEVVAVRRLELEIPAGAFFSIIGPSGCGKTTTLRMIAGLERPDAGTIAVGGTDVTHVPAYRRPVNTVFQSYALFPHLDVAANVAFGLVEERRPRDEVRRRVAEAVELVGLGGRERARPHELSGGQQQRVALARALVKRPSVLLLDEPLGALDLQLRKRLQGELRTLQRQVGTTFVYVTHDQEEAFSMSDAVAVMHEGELQQVGAPEDVYRRPATRFVADFVGAANVFPARVQDERVAGSYALAGAGGAALEATGPAGLGAGREVVVIVRPEDVVVGNGGASATVAAAAFAGAARHVTLDAGALGLVQATVPARADPLAEGDLTTVSWPADVAWTIA